MPWTSSWMRLAPARVAIFFSNQHHHDNKHVFSQFTILTVDDNDVHVTDVHV
jgi:hypothetical protein